MTATRVIRSWLERSEPLDATKAGRQDAEGRTGRGQAGEACKSSWRVCVPNVVEGSAEPHFDIGLEASPR